MIEYEGKYAKAKIFVTNNEETSIEETALNQVKALCHNPAAEGSKIRVMPDVHAGKGCVIGLTMTLGDKVMPNLVGVDIGCGITMMRFTAKKKDLDFNRLDKVIRENIPSGFSVREKPLTVAGAIRQDLEKLHCVKHINMDRALLSIGTLGGGNHFIEVDKDDEDNLYLAVHSGSRHLGVEITEWYLKQGQKALVENGVVVPYEMVYLEGDLKDMYLHDLAIAQQYASMNRFKILTEIASNMKWYYDKVFMSVHNYVKTESHINPELDDEIYYWDSPDLDTPDSVPLILHHNILRKGSISANKNEEVIIPINMRDGIILGRGLGNEDWNYSAPHGAGRIMSRKKAKESVTVSAFKKEMEGIHCTCVDQGTIDESPFAYRNIEDILEVIGDTIEVEKILNPIYNFKASETRKY